MEVRIRKQKTVAGTGIGISRLHEIEIASKLAHIFIVVTAVHEISMCYVKIHKPGVKFQVHDYKQARDSGFRQRHQHLHQTDGSLL